MNRRSTTSVLRDPNFYVVIFGYLSEIALLYLSCSQVPEEFLRTSHETANLQASIVVLPPFAVLLFGVLYAGLHNTARLLSRRYTKWMITPGLFFFIPSVLARGMRLAEL